MKQPEPEQPDQPATEDAAKDSETAEVEASTFVVDPSFEPSNRCGNLG